MICGPLYNPNCSPILKALKLLMSFSVPAFGVDLFLELSTVLLNFVLADSAHEPIQCFNPDAII